jgi:hypothetical protein
MSLRFLGACTLSLTALALTGCPETHSTVDAACRCDGGSADVPPPLDAPIDDDAGRDAPVLDVDPSCATPQDARPEGGCDAELGVVWTGDFCASISGCSCVGEDCDALYDSVAECVAAHPGCPRSCGGLTPFGSPRCLDTELCDYPDGSSCGGDDSTGVCRPRPTDCPEPGGVPVCGCDGVDYLTECTANLAGTDAASFGSCDTAGASLDEGKADGSCGLTGGHMWTFTFAEDVVSCDMALDPVLTVRVFRELEGSPGDISIPIGTSGAGGDAELCTGGTCVDATGQITIHGFATGTTANVSYDLTAAGGRVLTANDVSITLFCSLPPSGCR